MTGVTKSSLVCFRIKQKLLNINYNTNRRCHTMPCELKSQRLNMNGASISNHFHIFLRTERNKYYKHNIKARVNPNKYLSLIIDGMDQAKHNLPHFTTSTKVKSMLLVHVLNIILECFQILKAPVIRSSLRKKLTLSKHRCWVVPHKHQHCTISH